MLSFVLHHHNLALYYREGDMMKKGMLLKLFVTNLYLSAFTFGGGYVIVTLTPWDAYFLEGHARLRSSVSR